MEHLIILKVILKNLQVRVIFTPWKRRKMTGLVFFYKYRTGRPLSYFQHSEAIRTILKKFTNMEHLIILKEILKNLQVHVLFTPWKRMKMCGLVFFLWKYMQLVVSSAIFSTLKRFYHFFKNTSTWKKWGFSRIFLNFFRLSHFFSGLSNQIPTIFLIEYWNCLLYTSPSPRD